MRGQLEEKLSPVKNKRIQLSSGTERAAAPGNAVQLWLGAFGKGIWDFVVDFGLLIYNNILSTEIRTKSVFSLSR